ncbi:MAG: RagB/SusD family nutrient uptake outer membrane protein [Dysgonamonadaceae bacterium]|nr:RagB/SusD family nutrient uptake outer membrane protein [Dysgonamonadaceae bacterium]
MKLYNYITIMALSSILIFNACDEYEEAPIERFTIDYVFSKTDSLGDKAQKYLNTIYYAMDNGHNRVGNDYLDAASDDAVSSSLSETSVYRLSTGQYTSSNLVGGEMEWGKYYTAIRQANTFILYIDDVPLMAKFINANNDTLPMTSVWKAEARFLRAYFYFELLKRYGGIPIVRDVPYEVKDDMEIPRNSFKDCVQYIMDELDLAVDSLRTAPLEDPGGTGHVVTQGAARALQCRLLLYAASPLFNERPIENNNPLIGYLSYDPERWKTAADSARSFMNTWKGIYTLGRQFNGTFLNDYSNNYKEVIFFRQGSRSQSIEKINGPLGFSGTNQSTGQTSPTQNLVDAFPMLDGKAISDPTSKYNYSSSSQSMYDNRDPRLNYTVLHNGSSWLNKTLETYAGGAHNPTSATQTTKTSYYMRKFMGSFEKVDNYADELHVWILFRYAEILLNFAEAQNEYAGASSEVYQAVIDLRKRAGIEAGNDNLYGLKAGMTKDEMREIIRNERRIEMAFEEQRYWDIRRWRTAEEIFKQPLYGLSIANSSGLLTFSRTPVASISFDPKRYLYPIPYAEVIKNRNMVQNPE